MSGPGRADERPAGGRYLGWTLLAAWTVAADERVQAAADQIRQRPVVMVVDDLVGSRLRAGNA